MAATTYKTYQDLREGPDGPHFLRSIVAGVFPYVDRDGSKVSNIAYFGTSERPVGAGKLSPEEDAEFQNAACALMAASRVRRDGLLHMPIDPEAVNRIREFGKKFYPGDLRSAQLVLEEGRFLREAKPLGDSGVEGRQDLVKFICRNWQYDDHTAFNALMVAVYCDGYHGGGFKSADGASPGLADAATAFNSTSAVGPALREAIWHWQETCDTLEEYRAAKEPNDREKVRQDWIARLVEQKFEVRSRISGCPGGSEELTKDGPIDRWIGDIAEMGKGAVAYAITYFQGVLDRWAEIGFAGHPRHAAVSGIVAALTLRL